MKQIDTYVPRFQELGLFMAENSIPIFRLTVSEITYAYQEMNDWEEDIRINKIDKLNTEIRKQLELFIDLLSCSSINFILCFFYLVLIYQLF